MPRSLVLLSVALAEENLVVLAALCVALVGSVIRELFQATSNFDLKYFPHFSCCKKFLGHWRGSILSRLLLDEQTKYFARPAGTVCFCKRTQCFSFVLNAF